MIKIAAVDAARHLPGAVILAAAVIAWAAAYVIACAFWPFRACRRCDGTAKNRSPSGRAWRRCKRCKGTGAKLRVGRHVWNYFSDARKAADS